MVTLAALAAAPQNRPVQTVDFSRDIQPILANNCLECHGSDDAARKAGLRLDTREGALKAVIPGKSAKSSLVTRISASDTRRMPPASSGKRLTPVQVALVKSWIEQGAKYSRHWAFIPPKRPAIPVVHGAKFALRNPIDHFVFSRLKREGLTPSPEADRATLLRRVHLDLIGLPPSPEEVRGFIADNRPDAYERVVDRLMASQHYGERWARRWLDVARYADTNGYEKDRERSMWPYRDWVIGALNSDMPFDRFTIEQLAGDLLPKATQDQIVATGFHRNTMANEEGGIDLAEDRFKSMVDRVNTTGAAWLGLTVMCGQCHNHKYDPISQREYYGLYAFLDNTDEIEMDVVSDEIKSKRDAIQRKIDALVAAGTFQLSGSPDRDARFRQWLEENAPKAGKWTVVRPRAAVSQGQATMVVLPDDSVLVSGDKPNTDTYEVTVDTELPRVTAIRLEALSHASLPDGGPGRAHFFQRGGFILSEFEVAAGPKGGALRDVKIADPSANYEAQGRPISSTLDGKLDTGWMVTGQEGKDHHAVFPFAVPVENAGGSTLKIKLDQYLVHQVTLGRFRISLTGQRLPVKAAPFPAEVEDKLAKGSEPSTARDAVTDWYLMTMPEAATVNRQIAELKKQMHAYPTTLVFAERPSGRERVTHLRQRGEFLKPKEVVAPQTPKVMQPFAPDVPKNRLGLAKWLVSPHNPLTARVTMNREWQAFFGAGLVVTLEDFGTRGERPTHPDLLDWLSTEFMHPSPSSGTGVGKHGIPWSLKRMHRLIVTSATYRQSSRVTPALLSRDPANRLLARGPRFRVDAEMVRDTALAAAGLLERRIGGPSVYPPQPAEVTAQVYGGYRYPTSTGADRYRRGLYTHLKRTAPFAGFITFDAPTSEATCVRRVRSNTPLQSLTLLNDEVFVEAAQALAERVLEPREVTDDARIENLFLYALSRFPSPDEAHKVREFVRRQRTRFGKEAVALNFRPMGTASVSWTELSSWTLAARAILNLDEAITKQ